jgi:hypothetical protein
MQSAAGLAKLARWQPHHREYLSAIPSIADLPAMRLEDAGADGYRLDAAAFGARLSRTIREYCLEQRTTVFVLFFVAVSLLFHLRTRREKTAIWTAFGNRRFDDSLVGWMSEARVLGMPVDAGLSFNALVTQARSLILRALNDQEIPFAAIQHGGRAVSRDARRSDRLHVSLDVWDRRAVAPRRVSPELSVRVVGVPYVRGALKHAIRLGIDPARNLVATCVASPHVSAAAVRVLLDDLRAIVARCLEQPTEPVKAASSWS